MSQSDSGISIIELARQAGARKSLLKKMLLECIGERGMASGSKRLERQMSLKELALDMRVQPKAPSQPAIVPPHPPSVEIEFESRLARLETSFQQSVDSLAAKVHSLDQKTEVLRSDLRNLDLSGSQIGEQVKTFDQIFASLGRDAHKLSHTVEALAQEFRKPQDQTPEIGTLQDRLSRLESGMVRAIDLLQSPDHGLADLSQMRDRFSGMEAGIERVMKAVENLQSPPEDTEVLAEREATAKVLASLTKLVEGMRSSERRQVGLGDTRI